MRQLPSCHARDRITACNKQRCPPLGAGWLICGVNYSTCKLLPDTARAAVSPHARHILVNVFAKMISAAGAKEAELQGSSSVVRRNAVQEAVQGET